MKKDIYSLREQIRQVILEMYQNESELLDEENIEEERISNVAAAEKVNNRENFIGSHTYGEDLGDLGKMYVAYSYGEQHPLYMYYGGQWYYTIDDYKLPDGKPNKPTRKHLKVLRPNEEVQGRPLSWMIKMIDIFKKKHRLGDNSHTDLEPGEK